MPELARLVDYVCFSFALGTLPLQVLVLTAILRHLCRIKHNKSFFLFFAINTVVDVMSCFCLITSIMLPAWGVGIDFYISLGSTFGKILLIGSLWARVSQGFACLLIAVNRCSAILNPFLYETRWTTRLTAVCAVAQILAGAPLGVLLWFQDLAWKLNVNYATNPALNYSDVILADEPQVLKLVFREEKAKFLVFGSGFVVQFVLCLFLIICYLYMIYVFRFGSLSTTDKTLFSSAAYKQRRTVNSQLFKMAICVCTIEICFTVFTAVISSVCSLCISPNLFYALWDSLTILYSTAGPYVLLLCSGYSRHLVADTCRALWLQCLRVSSKQDQVHEVRGSRKPDASPVSENHRTITTG